MPCSRECPEVIQTNHVNVGQQGAQTVDEPGVAGPAMSVPVIYRVAPKLPLSTEVVGGNPRNNAGLAMFVQQKQLRVGPHIAGIRRNEERQIADQTHALDTGIVLHAIALAE